MNQKISEMLQVEEGVLNADIATDRTSAWYDASQFRRFAAKIFAKAVATGQVVTVQLLQAQDDAGTGSKALSSVTTVTATASPTEDLSGWAEAQDTDFDDGFSYIAVKLTSDDTTVLANANLIMAEGRFKPAA